MTLSAKVAELRAAFAELSDTYQSDDEWVAFGKRALALLSEREADAQRYRWLRDTKPWPTGLWDSLNVSGPGYWDASIDAAMEKGK